MRRITNAKRLAKAVKGNSFVYMKKDMMCRSRSYPEINDCDQARCAFCSALTRKGMTIRSMTIAGAVETKYAVIQTLKE